MAKLLTNQIQYPCKIEVGSGGNPQPGYVHVDVDETMPHLEAVCKMGKEALPFPENCAIELLSNHSIEHCSWLDVEFVVRDWFRVLQPGGRVFLRTPDLDFICRTLLEGKTTREAALDESNMVRIFGDCGPAEWANIKLFAGQDYPGNFHMFCLNMDMATRLFTRCGFKKISRLNIQPVFSPGELQIEAFKP